MAHAISYGPSLAELTFVTMDLFSRNDAFHADKKTLLTVYDPDDGETAEDETEVEVTITTIRILNVADQKFELGGRVLVADNQIGIWTATYSTKDRKGAWEIVAEEQVKKAPKIDVFTTHAVAQMCKVAPRTVSKWFDSGRLKGYCIPGSQDRRIPREYLVKFMQEHGMPIHAIEQYEQAHQH